MAPRPLFLLQQYPFPGNVRELQNAIEHAFVMCDGEELRPEHLPEHITGATALSARPTNGTSKRHLIEDTLKRHGGNRSAAASELGMHRTTLWRKLKTYQAGL